jgi:hypothetical protein
MKVGDKVICIEDYNNGGWLPKNYSVTKGQLYEVSGKMAGINYNQIDTSKITLEGKGNVKYPTNLFITIEQWREQQLNKILI